MRARGAADAIMDIDDVGGDIGMSARIPAASYKSLIRISAERGLLNQMDATVDLNYYPRAGREPSPSRQTVRSSM